MTKTYRSRSFSIGNLHLGGDEPVCIQSMTNTDTNDIEASVKQCRRIIEGGAQMVRLTTQGEREVSNLWKIRKALHLMGYQIPVVADIHFKPALALEAARVADKIRINPGNYLKGKSVASLLPELLETCREFGTAIRIGVNHGSLDESILNEYGDTPAGMVESAMQFLRVCRDLAFDNVVVSMKSSNPRVMVQSVRLLTHKMALEEMWYPLHLGVTEAGDGLQGRIKSAVGMAPLLLEGMGDTLRVSLTEPPEEEMPVASKIVLLFPKPIQLPYNPFHELAWDPFSFNRRRSQSINGIGNGTKVKIISNTPPEPNVDLSFETTVEQTVSYEQWQQNPGPLEKGNRLMLLEQGSLSIQEVKLQLNRFCTHNQTAPIIFKTSHHTEDPELFQLQLAGELGSLLVDGAIDAVWVTNANTEETIINDILLSILQAAGARISKPEYIACPSCGRTHFDILTRLKEIREATSHLISLKIGIMGCIVNGPGEMADAHYGYVGAGPGRVTLYRGKDPVLKNIPEKEALKALIDLMKQEGDWVDP